MVRNFKVSLILSGSAQLFSEHGSQTITAGQLVLIAPGTQCESIPISPVSALIAHINPAFVVDQVRWAQPEGSRDRETTFQSLLDFVSNPLVIDLEPPIFDALLPRFERLVALSKSEAQLGMQLVQATKLIWEIDWLLSEQNGVPPPADIPRAAAPEPLREEVRKALRLIHDHHDRDLNLIDLARAVSLSESALRRAVRAATGLSPRSYLQQVRLLRFERLVAETTLPLAQITRMVGWSSAAHARETFARSHGMPPREFRTEAQYARRANWLRQFDS